jgi:putative flippase GtrA
LTIDSDALANGVRFILLRLHAPGLPSFALVGVVGFIVDAVILSILFYFFGFGHFASRAVSFLVAVTTTWWLNRRKTFIGTASANWSAELLRYFFTQGIGAFINLGIYTLCITSFELFAAIPVIPLAIGASVALIFNFLSAKHFVFIT